MCRSFKTADYEATLDVTVRLGDCLPPDHLARFVVDTIAQLDLAAIYTRYGRRGGQPYAPEILLALLFYGYATGVFSTRKLERATYETVPFRFIAGNLHPDHDTLAAFRKTFLPELKDLFVQVLLLAHMAGALKLGNISLDGTKIHADASKSKAVSYQHLFTDPESRIMKHRSTEGFEQDYNAQLAVDQDSLLIVGVTLANHPTDQREAEPTLDTIPPQVGSPAAGALDNGYFSESNIAACERRGVDPYIATGRDPHHPSWQQRFAALPAPPADDASPTVKMAYKLKTVLGKVIYGLRKCTVEPVIGIIKEVLGFRQFSLRGEMAAAGEWCLVCLAFALSRLHTLLQG